MDMEQPKGGDEEQVKQETAETVGQEPLTAEDLARFEQELEQKAGEEQVRLEKDVDQKILDRESLISQLKERDSLLTKTRRLLEDYRRFTDPESLAKIKQLEASISQLEKERQEMEQQVESISDTPDVLSKLQAEALGEDYKKEYGPLMREGLRPAMEKMSRLAEEIKTFSESERNPISYSIWERGVAEKRQRAESSGKKAVDFLEKCFGELAGSEFTHSISEAFWKSKSWEEFVQQIEAKRKSLGLLQRREKKAIDAVLHGGEYYFKEYEEAQKEASSSRDAIEKAKKDEKDRKESRLSALAEEYKGAVLIGWEIENKMIELAKERGVSPFGESYGEGCPRFSAQIDSSLTREMEGLAGITKGHSWDEALRRPETRAMFDTWREVVSRAGGSKLAEVNPLEAKKNQEGAQE